MRINFALKGRVSSIWLVRVNEAQTDKVHYSREFTGLIINETLHLDSTSIPSKA